MKTTTLLLLSAALATSACSTRPTSAVAGTLKPEAKSDTTGRVYLSPNVVDRRFPLHGGKFGR